MTLVQMKLQNSDLRGMKGIENFNYNYFYIKNVGELCNKNQSKHENDIRIMKSKI